MKYEVTFGESDMKGKDILFDNGIIRLFDSVKDIFFKRVDNKNYLIAIIEEDDILKAEIVFLNKEKIVRNEILIQNKRELKIK